MESDQARDAARPARVRFAETIGKAMNEAGRKAQPAPPNTAAKPATGYAIMPAVVAAQQKLGR